jgi:hypothetical protein
LLQAFPFPSTLGEVILHPLSQAGVFIYSSRGKLAFPPLCGVFLPPPLLQAFPLLVAVCVPLLLPSPAGLFIYSSVRDSPHPSSALRVPHPLCYVSFLLLLLIIQGFFPLFSLGGGRSVQGAMLIWPGLSVEYRVPLSSPCGLCLPKPSGHWCLVAARGLSWLLHLT